MIGVSQKTNIGPLHRFGQGKTFSNGVDNVTLLWHIEILDIGTLSPGEKTCRGTTGTVGRPGLVNDIVMG
jgi:hypothetical protein